jgi:F-type H+-transporting ATPase subunit b
MLCVVAGCFALVEMPVVFAAQDVEGAMEKAEGELAAAAHSDPEHSGASTDPLSVDPDLAIWTLVVFVVLLAVLRKFAWGPILHALEGRESSIAEHIAQAERNHEQAKLLLSQYEQKLAVAANEVREMLDEARRDAEKAKAAILAEAKSGADAERLRALRDIETASDAALESLAKRSAELAVDLAGKILQSKLTPAEHGRLVEEAMSKFPASSRN